MRRGAPSSSSSSSPFAEQPSDDAAQTDTSAMSPGYNEPQLYQEKVKRISRIAWVAGAILAIILGMLTSCVIYLFMRDSSTENAIKIRDMAVKEIEGDLERYARVYWLQLEEDERHLTMLTALRNESDMLKAQLAESVARDERHLTMLTAFRNESDMLKAQLAESVARDERHLTMLTAFRNESDMLKAQLAESVAREESMNRTVSTIINELTALKLAVLDEQRKEESLSRTFSAIISELLALKVSIPDDQRMSQQPLPTGQDIYSTSAEARDISTMRMHSSSTSLHLQPVNVIGALCFVLCIPQSL